MNPAEPKDFPLGAGICMWVERGGKVTGYVNLDLFAVPGVSVCGDVERLPFPDGIFQRVECDAALEHVRDPILAMQ
jgi:hypothetical protein